MDDDLPTPAEILATHEEIEKAYDLKHRGARVAAPRLKIKRLLRDVEQRDEVYPRAGQLLRDLVTSHFFEDGNKRTAWITMREYLDRHGEQPAETGEGAERVLRRIRRFDPDEIAAWLETGTIDEDRLEP